MPGIFFTNVWMLAGLAALSVPVIIHLLLKRKKKRVRFSTVQFFQKRDEQSSQRRKLRNWLLLALRLLICTLLVLAFARPYLQNRIAGAAQRQRQVLILLDRSLSMQANATDGPKWVRARESARQILSQLKPDDRAALISCGPRAEVLSEWAPAIAVSKLLPELQPTCGAANLGDGLQQARRLLSFAHADAAVTLYVISDFQRSGCQNLASYPVPQQVEVKLVPVGDLATPNLAVMDLQIESKQDASPHAVLASFSDEDTPELKLQFSVDSQIISSRSLALSSGGFTNIELTVPPLKPGWHDASVQMRVNDSLALDNTRFQTVFVPEPAHALVVETRPGKRSFEEESFFVTMALDPAKDSTNGAPSRFAFEKVSADELATKLAGAKGQLPCDFVVMPGLKSIPSALGHVLLSYVQAGGGLLLFVGEGVSANHYNAEFRGLLPAALGVPEACADPESPWRIGEYNTNLAMFAAFHLPNSGNLSLARFMNRFALTESDPKGVAARFEDGTPFVVSGTLGRGRVVLVNTSVDTSWNDWPKHKTFVPWLHGTARYLAGAAAAAPAERQVNFVAGLDPDLDLGAAAAKGRFQIHTPEGKALAVVADDLGQLRDVPLSKPGVYSVRDASGKEVRRLAVNVPPQESDLAALSSTDFQQQLARVTEGRQTTLVAGLFGSSGNHQELWRVLLLTVVVLLLVELFVANRTLA
jgi:Aerotolerance regulator N-terminal/von Willebrand factor type A domain